MIGLNVCLVFFVCFLMVLQYFTKNNRIHRKITEMKKQLFFGPFLGLAVNGFIPICIATSLNRYHLLRTTPGELYANIFALYLFVFIFVWLPLVMLYVIFADPVKQ